MTFNADAVAGFIEAAHRDRATYANVPAGFGLTTIDDAYAAQEALAQRLSVREGPVAGLKIATTTKIMQQLMGIDHPCGGMIFARRIHRSPARIERRHFVNLVIECELAVRLGHDLPKRDTPYSRTDVRDAVATAMPAFELIEDRHAVYKDTQARSLIADNAWNGGIVIGEESAVAAGVNLNDVAGTLTLNGATHKTGRTDDPMGALAWVANLAIARGRPMTRGMIVITGSVIPTLPIRPDERFTFALEGLGSVEMAAP